MAPRPRSTASPGGRGGSPVIAKLCRLEVASVERTVYEEVLPPPPPHPPGPLRLGPGRRGLVLDPPRGDPRDQARGPLRGAPGPGGALAGRPPFPDERAGADLESAGTGSAPLPPVLADLMYALIGSACQSPCAGDTVARPAHLMQRDVASRSRGSGGQEFGAQVVGTW
jgi:hypothetical protein